MAINTSTDWRKKVECHLEELYYTGKTEIPRWIMLRAFNKENGGRINERDWNDIRQMFVDTFVDPSGAPEYTVYRLSPDHKNKTTPTAFLMVLNEAKISNVSPE